MLNEDRRAQFQMAVLDACLSAALAGLWVDVESDDGSTISGTPSAPVPAQDTEALDDLGYCTVVVIGDREVDLRAVVSITIHAPASQ